MQRTKSFRLMCFLLILAMIFSIAPTPLLADYDPGKGDRVLDSMKSDWTKTAIIVGAALVVGLTIYFATRDRHSDALKEKERERKNKGEGEQSDSLNSNRPFALRANRTQVTILKDRDGFDKKYFVDAPNPETSAPQAPNLGLAMRFGYRQIFIGVIGSF